MKTIHVSSMVDVLALDTSTLDAGDRITTMSYHPPVFPSQHFLGGRSYIWTPTRPTSDHDGGTYISLSAPWDGTHAGLEDFLNGVGDMNPCGNGCMVLEHPEEVWVEDYGAVGDDKEDANTVDDGAAFEAAFNRVLRFVHTSLIQSGTVRLRATQYYVNRYFNIKTQVKIEGTLPGSHIRFQKNLRGFIIHRDDTIDDTTVDPPTGDAAGTVLRNFTMEADFGDVTTSHGIWMRRACLIDRVTVMKFSGNGINIEATATSGDPARVGNANGWALYSVNAAENKGHGVYVDGADVNAGYAFKVDATHNEGWGIYDSSFLGNTWVGCHTADNDLGAYHSDNANARTILIGCYSEGNQPTSILASPAMAIGGLHGAGLQGSYMDAGDLHIRDVHASRQITVDEDGLDYMEHFVANNDVGSGALHSRRVVGFEGYSSKKVIDESPRPCGGMYCGPQTTDPNDATVVGWQVYDGEAVDTITRVLHIWGHSDLSPENDNELDLGWAGGQYKDIYLVNSPIVSSDLQLKQDVRPLEDAELAVAVRLKGLVRAYRLKASVKDKGAQARLHVGIIAQEVVQAFADEGLNAFDYGIVCRRAAKVGERYSIRYEELLAFIVAAL